jgi:hypothetical protein
VNHKALSDRMKDLQDGLAVQSRAYAAVTVDVEAITARLAAIQQLMAAMKPGPEPDANGWIPRPTLR